MAAQEPKSPTVAGSSGALATDNGLPAIVDHRGKISKGWQVKIRDTGIATEFTVTLPDGREPFFHDCWNP